MEELELSNARPAQNKPGNFRRPGTNNDLQAVTELETISQRLAGNVANGNGIGNGVIANGTRHITNNVAPIVNGYGAALNGNVQQHVANGTRIVNNYQQNAQQKLGDMYTNIANQRRGEIRMYDMDNVNHI